MRRLHTSLYTPRALFFSLLFGAQAACNVGNLVGGGCMRRLSPCDGECVNLGSDRLNCGTCGHECSSSTECKAGTCIPSERWTSLTPDDDANRDAGQIKATALVSTTSTSLEFDSGVCDAGEDAMPCGRPIEGDANHPSQSGVDCSTDVVVDSSLVSSKTP
jgi:hypothetical protein